MNKKRLYKQNGHLHPRAEKLKAQLHRQVRTIFDDNARFSPRDLEVLLFGIIHYEAGMAIFHRDSEFPCKEVPETVMAP